MAIEWLPLGDVLAHENVKLLIFHGGLNSVYEAIDREIPMLIFPFSHDQPYNAKIMENKEIAVVLDINDFTVENLKISILKAINLKENVRKIKKLVEEKPLEIAVKSIEKLIELKKEGRWKNDENSKISFDLIFETIFLLFLVKIFYGKMKNFMKIESF